jgi:hypothetical protein
VYNLKVPHGKLTRKISFLPHKSHPVHISGPLSILSYGNFDEESIRATFKIVQITVKELQVRDPRKKYCSLKGLQRFLLFELSKRLSDYFEHYPTHG